MPRTPFFKVTYNGTDITADISRYLLRLTVADKAQGESDEINIELEDTEALWRGPWYPSKGDKLTVELGYTDLAFSFGTFEIDEVEFKGPPDTVSIKGLAASISQKLRTKKSSAHEGKTLKQIAEKVAEANGLTVQGEIEQITIGRVTQDRETDLGFLRRLAAEYGYIFNVRDTNLIFTSVYDIEKISSVDMITRQGCLSYSLKDTSSDTFSEANVSYFDPETGENVQFQMTAPSFEQAAGYAFGAGSVEERVQQVIGNTVVEQTVLEFLSKKTGKPKADILELRAKAENKGQAEAQAKAALHKANSRQVTGSITLPGDPRLMSGNNFDLRGFAGLDGKFNIESAEHRLDRSGGYVCSIEIKKVG
jgi:phage protein D